MRYIPDVDDEVNDAGHPVLCQCPLCAPDEAPLAYVLEARLRYVGVRCTAERAGGAAYIVFPSPADADQAWGHLRGYDVATDGPCALRVGPAGSFRFAFLTTEAA